MSRQDIPQWVKWLRDRDEEVFNETRADTIGQNGNDGQHYAAPENPMIRHLIDTMTQEEESMPAEQKHDCIRCGGSYWSPEHDKCPCLAPRTPDNKYQREIKPGVFVDVYDVLAAWAVDNPALQHLIKKALQPGDRGHKTREQDMADILASAKRAQELES